MYRVELKGDRLWQQPPLRRLFLMYRVELKAIKSKRFLPHLSSMFLMYRVELKAGASYGS